MNMFNQALKNNPLKTYQDFENSLFQLIEPVYQLMATQKTPGRFHASDSGSVYSEDRRDIEGFLRTLWGLGPLYANSKKVSQFPEYFKQANEGIVAGTDPNSEYYWGELNDYDQLFVEMGALATYLILTKRDFWDHQSPVVKENIYQWTNQINHHVIPNTNWLFFRILINSFYEHADLAFSKEQLAEDLGKIDTYYLADGWYFDGYENQIDYYIPFALQYYALLLSKIGKNQQLPQIAIYKERGALFAKTFKDWFVKNGASLPFGRSLTYRFAQSAYFSAGLFAEIDFKDFSKGEAKYLLMQNLRNWYQQPIFTSDGVLSIGYYYPNLVMAEGYNAPGSPYWAMKSYLILALGEEHPFWQLAEKQPHFPEKVVNPHTRMILVHDASGQEVQAFTMGQHSHEHAQGENKYEKFVYSTTFGVSMAKGGILPKQGAYDNTLAVSEKETHYETVFGYDEFQVHEDYLYGLWRPYANTTIKTFIVPCYPWHIRIHLIETDRQLNLIAGSFSAPDYGQTLIDSDSEVRYQSAVGTIGLKSFSDTLTTSLTQPEPNTNLLYNKTVLAQANFQVAPGQEQVIYACLGNAYDLAEIDQQLSAELVDDQLIITHLGEKTTITLTELTK